MADTDKSNTPDTGLTDAASAFEALLGGREPNPTAEELDDERLDEADTEDETATDEPDEDLEDEEGEDEDAEEDADADAEEDEGEELSEDTLVTVKIDGKEEKIPLKEALDGYQRQADYSRKTQDLAEQRRAFQSEVQQLQTERQQYSQLLTALQNQLQNEPEPDWDRLKREDPLEYTLQREEFRDRQERQQAIRAEQTRLQQAQQQQQMAQLSETVQQERTRLLEAVPEWQDQKKWEAARNDLREYGKKLGYTDEDLSNAYDHRAVLALYKAMQYDRIASRKGKPVQVERKGPRPMNAGPAAPRNKRATDLSKANQRLARTGSVQDAANVFEKLL